MNRRGFSLAELLVALTLTLFLAGVVAGILNTSAQSLRDRSERFGLEQSLRVALASGRSMLGPLGVDSSGGGDLLSAGPSSLIARVTRGTGVVCAAFADRILVRSGPVWWTALRGLVAGRDSLLISTGKGSRWVRSPLRSNMSSGVCPGGEAALTLPATIAPTELPLIGPGSVVRVFEPVELRVYSSAGASWIGIRQVATGEAVQPLAGPFREGAPGFRYEAAGGALAGMPADIVVAWVELVGVSERAGGVGMARVARVQLDSLSLAVLLRGVP